MKEQFENQEIEKMISDRLSAFEASPSDSSKEKIFAAIQRPWYRSRRYAVAALLMLLIPASYFGWRYQTSERLQSAGRQISAAQVIEEKSGKIDAEIPTIDQTEKNSLLSSEADVNISAIQSLTERTGASSFIEVFDLEKEEVVNAEKPILLASLDPLFISNSEKIILPVIDSKPSSSSQILGKKDILPDKKKKGKRLSVNLDALTFITFQRIVPNTTDEIVVKSISSPSILSPKRLGFRFGVGASWKLSESFDVLAGFSTYSQRIANEISISGTGESSFLLNEEANAYTVTPETETISIDERIWSVGAQVGLRYFLPQSNRKFWLGGMLDFQSAFDNQLTESFYINKKQTYLNIEAGWKTSLTDRLEFQINPNLSYSLMGREENQAVFKIHPFSFGLNIGVRYKIW